MGRAVAETGDPIRQQKHNESMQKVIVYFVVGLLTFTLVAMITKWFYDPSVDISKYASAVLAPVLGPSGTVISFFFSAVRKGSQEANRRLRTGRTDLEICRRGSTSPRNNRAAFCGGSFSVPGLTSMARPDGCAGLQVRAT